MPPEDSDSDAMPLGSNMTTGERRDAQVRVLETLTALLTDQMAELAATQAAAASRLHAADERMARLEAGLADNTSITHEVRDLLEAFKGGFRVLGWLGVAVKWVGGIATACAAIYTLFYMSTHGGDLPGGK